MKLINQSICKVMFEGKIPAGKLFKSFGILLVLSCGIFAQQWTWKPFSPANKGWQVIAPGAMQPDPEAAKPNSKKGSYAYNDYNGFFAIIYRDSPRRWVPWNPDYNAYLKKERDDVVKANHGVLIKDEQFSTHGVVGREVYIKIPGGTMQGVEGQTVTRYRIQRFRMFFYGRRFYVILAVVPENIVDTPEIDNYMNSFAANTEPDAIDNSYSTDEDTVLMVNAANGVLANDKDVDGDKLTVSAPQPLTQPTHGILVLKPDGSFTYKPNPDYNGKDSFTYMANDGAADSDPATVTITINPVNDPPTFTDVPSSVFVDELKLLAFKVTGNDIDSPPSSLRFSLTGAPTGASIDSKTGQFTWTPTEAQGPGDYTFQINLSDGQASVSSTVKVGVKEVNVAPQISNVPAAVINELEPYSFTARATDSDIPVQTLTFSLSEAPAGANINPSTGQFSWTPTEAQGPGAYRFTINVSDGLVNTSTPVSLTVMEINSAPVLTSVSAQTIDELKPFSITLQGTDTDIPANTLTYSLDPNAPAGIMINPKTGVISWIPTEAQGPVDYSVTARVTDNGSPALSDSRTFNIHVNEINSAPVLAAIDNKTIDEEMLLSFTVVATDTDLPANTLSYGLIEAPAGAVINSATGQFTWTPTEAQGPGDYSVTVQVTDNGTPALSDTKAFKIHVSEVNKAPLLAGIGNKTVDEETPLSFIASATDADLPANKLSYSLLNAPAGAVINPTTGQFSWTPTEAQGPGVYNMTVRVTDNGTPTLSAEETIKITVNEVNKAPIAMDSSVNTDKDTAISLTLKTVDADLPANTLTYQIVSAPAHGNLSGNAPNLTYKPNPDYNGTDSFTFKVNDGQFNSKAATVNINIKPAKP